VFSEELLLPFSGWVVEAAGSSETLVLHILHGITFKTKVIFMVTTLGIKESHDVYTHAHFLSLSLSLSSFMMVIEERL
jgi:hypothetical protein